MTDKPASLDQAITDFPELAHYTSRPAMAVALAAQLRTFDEPELSMRRGNLAKTIQAENDGRIPITNHIERVRIPRLQPKGNS